MRASSALTHAFTLEYLHASHSPELYVAEHRYCSYSLCHPTRRAAHSSARARLACNPSGSFTRAAANHDVPRHRIVDDDQSAPTLGFPGRLHNHYSGPFTTDPANTQAITGRGDSRTKTTDHGLEVSRRETLDIRFPRHPACPPGNRPHQTLKHVYLVPADCPRRLLPYSARVRFFASATVGDRQTQLAARGGVGGKRIQHTRPPVADVSQNVATPSRHPSFHRRFWHQSRSRRTM
ncbi:hypothetical protein SAMN06295879_2898 [Agreia bicolorata]|uniref:Uncharacterized protein n=1 Tax=Agreia bicolorata TaxID=110935 RepID=A0A1T4YE03_9MICO|nr:hypothetical protein SAMN06295879_2898 [Agreia bicolorata]